jgi:hypothetical protein
MPREGGASSIPGLPCYIERTLETGSSAGASSGIEAVCPDLSATVSVILDPGYGERLRDIWPGRPVWIAMSPTNESTVRSLWTSHPDSNHLSGITGFQFNVDADPTNTFLDNLDTIDLHHGPYSSESPYTVLEVIGVSPTRDVQESLRKLGFDEFSGSRDRFIARRSAEQARIRRDWRAVD